MGSRGDRPAMQDQSCLPCRWSSLAVWLVIWRSAELPSLPTALCARLVSACRSFLAYRRIHPTSVKTSSFSTLGELLV